MRDDDRIAVSVAVAQYVARIGELYVELVDYRAPAAERVCVKRAEVRGIFEALLGKA